jgi:HK97 family phage major capsid protein
VPLPTANLNLLDVVPMVPVTTETVEYVYEETFTNAAVETAEGDAAGEGVSTWNKTSVTCVWVPFSIPATKQILTDEPRMQAFLQNRLLYGVKARLQNQLINGNGQGENLKGITYWPSILTHRSGADSDYPFDVVHKAMTAVRIQTYGMYEPQVLLVHPNDLELMTLAKDGMDRYYYGGPQADTTRPVWGMTPISHPDISQGSPIVCDINACECYVREDVNLSVTDSHADNFTKGIIQFLAQGRFAFAILERRAFCEILDFDS